MNNNHPVDSLSVVFYNDLKHAEDFGDTFDCVSYGDAAHTLVEPETIINYLEDRNSEGQYTNLIGELKDISLLLQDISFFIALEG